LSSEGGMMEQKCDRYTTALGGELCFDSRAKGMK
jgi:hypothetical protein